MTDNVRRTAANVRDIIKTNGWVTHPELLCPSMSLADHKVEKLIIVTEAAYHLYLSYLNARA